MDVSVYINPECSNCRTAEGILRERGVDANYVRYLEKAPTREDLEDVLAKLGTDDPREILRTKEPEYEQLGLGNASRDELLDAMVAHPILINRPIVVTPLGVKLCRPSETVLDILPGPQRGAFAKEDGERVVDAQGRRVG